MQSKNSYSDKPALDYLFHPRSIAVVGVSNDMTKWNWGREFREAIIKSGFKGRVYPVGLGGGEISGLKIYPSIKDIPGSIDYVISAIPAQFTPQLVAGCADKGVRAIHMFTSGFSELDSEEGRKLESEIITIARQRGIRIIGPNCMGLYCPRSGLSYSSDFPKESGPVGYIVQSGGNSAYGVLDGASRGVYFSKVISFGNATDLTECDFLEYLAHDPETKIITAYIEGVKDGIRFMKVLKQATRLKPVIIYKGGTTESGIRAAASHTRALAGSKRIWESLLKQAGAIQAHSVEELNDIALLFIYMSPPKGKNMVAIGTGGGASVQVADECANAGLDFPVMPVEIRRKLRDIIGFEAGLSFNNPLDVTPLAGKQEIKQAIRLVTSYDQIDLLMAHVPVDNSTRGAEVEVDPLDSYYESIIELGEEINKRTVVVLHSIIRMESKVVTSRWQTKFYKAGFPVYPTVSRAATAIARFIQYHQQRKEDRIWLKP